MWKHTVNLPSREHQSSKVDMYEKVKVDVPGETV